ncbi:MAG: dephospho-CoA kinase [Actinomycetia bacterium]|nr:dephospho-CoA kinase [Actinomycetes bacterium]
MSDQDSPMRMRPVLLGGGIGAGKTRVAMLFADSGFHVISTDRVGHEQLRQGSQAVAAIETIWPEAVQGGVVDRSVLAGIVFADEDALAELESITHPGIERDVREMIARAERPVLVEVPILKVFADDPFTRIAVIADDAVRLERVVARGGDETDTRQRMSAQPSNDLWREWATIVIDNTGDWAATVERVDDVIQMVLERG